MPCLILSNLQTSGLLGLLKYLGFCRLKDHWIYLIQERNNELLKGIRDEQKRLRFEKRYPNHTNDIEISRICWIESLYAKSLDDFMKYCIWRIFTYFVNVRRLSRSEAFNLVMDWLGRCSSECLRLDFNARQKVNDSLNSVMLDKNLNNSNVP
jgi:hypothetical protein